ncbi:MAG: YbaB/EbfC family nucleoid-associated protein [Candidatus Absconditabacterales bacterium]|nr:YbaB/EbfC family nucleoid-associated protein [Candidatus Absconditabacterales bacterium]
MGELKKMYDKYKQLQDALKKLIIRAKQGKYINAAGEEIDGGVVVDMSGEMKLKSISINDETLLTNKPKLEETIKEAFIKAQNKAQEVVAQKTKDILGFDPSDMANMMSGGGMPKIPGLT